MTGKRCSILGRTSITDQRRPRYNIFRAHVCSEIYFRSTISEFRCPFHRFTTRHLTAAEYGRALIGKMCTFGPQYRHLEALSVGLIVCCSCIVVVLIVKECNHRSVTIYIILYSRK